MDTKTEFKPSVLIVDDMQVNLTFLLDILKDKYTLKVAKNGQRALDIAKQGNVDLILLDIVMPQMDGYEVCKALKADKQTQDIPIIFVTANSESEDEAKGFALGAVDYITKPFQVSTVLSRVQNHLALHLKQLELEDLNRKTQRYLELIDKYVITSSTDLDGTIVSASEAFCSISGYSKEELIGQNHRIVRHNDMPSILYKQLWNTITQDKTWSGEIKNRKKDGNYYWVEAAISPIYNELGKKIGYTAIRQDITDKKLIEEISITDGLTNIYNRRYFNETFPKVIDGAKREDELVCFLLMDIDHFKQYNDNYGHQAGDDVLIRFAQCMKDNLKRADDMAFRLGGEEFGIVYKSDTKEKSLEFANTIREQIEALEIPHEYSSASKYVTASMGLVSGRASTLGDMDSVFKQADDLLYEAKESGRNQVKTK